MLKLNLTVAPLLHIIPQQLAWRTETPQLRIVGHLAARRTTCSNCMDLFVCTFKEHPNWLLSYLTLSEEKTTSPEV